MSKLAKRKLIIDLKNLNKEKQKKIFSAPYENNLFFWKSILLGPSLSPMNDAVFYLFMEVPVFFPNSPPKIKLVNKRIFHPNVYSDGLICLDILQKKWSPGFSLETVLTSIQCLLIDPNTESPANLGASELIVSNRFEYFRKIKKISKKSWKI